MNEIDGDGIEGNKIHSPKKNGVTKKYGSELLSNLNNFLFHHKRRKIKEAREYISEVHKGTQYIKEYYSHPSTLQKIRTKLSDAYDAYLNHFIKKRVSKEEYIHKTISHLEEGLKNIHCCLVNNNSRRTHIQDRENVKRNRDRNFGFFATGTKFAYVFNKGLTRRMSILYGKQYIKSEIVHELDHYVQQLLFNFSECYPIAEIRNIYNQKSYDEEKVNPLYLYLQKEIQGLFGNRKNIYQQLLRIEVERQKKDTKKDTNYELNLLEILSRIRQLKLARLRSLDDELDLESLKDYDLSFDSKKNMYAGEILSQIVDKNKFLEFANSIR